MRFLNRKSPFEFGMVVARLGKSCNNVNRRALKSVLCICAIVVLTTSCSKLDFFYRQLDWLIPHYIDDYVDLTREQEKILDEKVSAFLRWHCQVEIPKYVSLLETWLRLADKGKLDRLEYNQQRKLVREYFQALGKKAAIELKPMISSLDERQLMHIIHKIEEDNAEIKKEYVDENTEDAQSALESELEERYQRWLGDLNDIQLQWIKAASFKMLAYKLALFENRERWLDQLRQLWKKEKSMDSVADFLYYTVTERERYWSKNYRLRYFDYSKENELLTLKLMNSLSQKQLSHLKRKLVDLKAQLGAISCQ